MIAIPHIYNLTALERVMTVVALLGRGGRFSLIREGLVGIPATQMVGFFRVGGPVSIAIGL
jgi:hypothetical protein